MKKLLSFLAVAFMSVAYGNDTPDVVMKNGFNATLKADIEQAIKYFYFKSEEAKQKHIQSLIDKLADEAKGMQTENGGIKSIKTSTISETDNVAEVKVVVTHKNGEVESFTKELKKIGNNWYIGVIE